MIGQVGWGGGKRERVEELCVGEGGRGIPSRRGRSDACCACLIVQSNIMMLMFLLQSKMHG